MGIISILGSWPNSRRRAEQDIIEEAEALMDLWGETAEDVAANLSWKEDIGLIGSPSPGYWARVHQEIGRRPRRGQGFPSIPLSPRPPIQDASPR